LTPRRSRSRSADSRSFSASAARPGTP
jgi:hypothetical protein